MASPSARLVLGYLSAIGKMITGTLSACCTQMLHGTLPDFQLSVGRSLVQVIIYIIVGKVVRTDINVERKNLKALLYLGFLLLIYNVGYYGATVYLPLTDAYGVVLIAGIVSAFLQSRFYFHNDVSKSQLTSLLVCISGIFLVAQPSWIFNQVVGSSEMTPSTFENSSHNTRTMNMSDQNEIDTTVTSKEVLLGFISSIIGGTAEGLMLDINNIVLKDTDPFVKVIYVVSFCLVGSVAFMFYMEDPILALDLSQFSLLLGHGVLSAATTFLFLMSSHFIPGPTISAIFSFQMVIVIISQYTIMHSIQPGNSNWIEVIGCIVIIFGASIHPTVDILAHRAKSNELP